MVPGHPPKATNLFQHSADHSWVLQSVAEIQKSTGALTEAVSSLRAQIEKQEKMLNRVGHMICAAAAVVTVLAAIAAFVFGKI